MLSCLSSTERPAPCARRAHRRGFMNYRTLAVEKQGAILVVTLNRPEVLNAINTQMGHDL